MARFAEGIVGTIILPGKDFCFGLDRTFVNQIAVFAATLFIDIITEVNYCIEIAPFGESLVGVKIAGLVVTAGDDAEFEVSSLLADRGGFGFAGYGISAKGGEAVVVGRSRL